MDRYGDLRHASDRNVPGGTGRHCPRSRECSSTISIPQAICFGRHSDDGATVLDSALAGDRATGQR